MALYGPKLIDRGVLHPEYFDPRKEKRQNHDPESLQKPDLWEIK